MGKLDLPRPKYILSPFLEIFSFKNPRILKNYFKLPMVGIPTLLAALALTVTNFTNFFKIMQIFIRRGLSSARISFRLQNSIGLLHRLGMAPTKSSLTHVLTLKH